MVYTNEKLQYKNGVKMVYMPSDVPESLDITGLEKHLGRVTTYIRTHLMSGIRLVKNRTGAKFATVQKEASVGFSDRSFLFLT